MFSLTIKGRAIGRRYTTEQDVIKAYIRMYPVILGLGWGKCR